MTEEIQTSAKQPKNTVALIGMIFSIIWLILAITVVFFPFGLFFLAIWFILWLIGLFYKPRGKARIAIIIPVITFIAMLITWLWARKSIKTPAIEFANWANENITPRLNWDLDENKFQQILTDEVNKVISSKTKPEGVYYVHHASKIRYINPLVKNARIYNINKSAKEMIDNNLAYDMSNYIYLG